MNDSRDPITAYLSMHIDLINDADSDLGVRLSANGAACYLQALYDLQRIQPDTFLKHRGEIDRLRSARLAVFEEREKAEAMPLQNGCYWYLGVTRPCSKCSTGVVTMTLPNQLQVCPACVGKD